MEKTAVHAMTIVAMRMVIRFWNLGSA